MLAFSKNCKVSRIHYIFENIASRIPKFREHIFSRIQFQSFENTKVSRTHIFENTVSKFREYLCFENTLGIVFENWLYIYTFYKIHQLHKYLSKQTKRFKLFSSKHKIQILYYFSRIFLFLKKFVKFTTFFKISSFYT